VSRHALVFPLLDFSHGGVVSPGRLLPSISPVWYYKAAFLPFLRLVGVSILLPPYHLVLPLVVELVVVPSPHGPPRSRLELGEPLPRVLSASPPFFRPC